MQPVSRIDSSAFARRRRVAVAAASTALNEEQRRQSGNGDRANERADEQASGRTRALQISQANRTIHRFHRRATSLHSAAVARVVRRLLAPNRRARAKMLTRKSQYFALLLADVRKIDDKKGTLVIVVHSQNEKPNRNAKINNKKDCVWRCARRSFVQQKTAATHKNFRCAIFCSAQKCDNKQKTILELCGAQLQPSNEHRNQKRDFS